LGPRSTINAFTGATAPAAPYAGTDVLARRLQIPQTDLTTTTFPGALFFAEGVYVSRDDAPAGNALNNASYKQMTVDPASFSLSPAGAMRVGTPAIFAWRDHGRGLNTPDPSVIIVPADVPNEGRFYIAAKNTDLGNGLWRYDYAVFNLNSHQSAA